jgi:hypothetical protein
MLAASVAPYILLAAANVIVTVMALRLYGARFDVVSLAAFAGAFTVIIGYTTAEFVRASWSLLREIVLVPLEPPSAAEVARFLAAHVPEAPVRSQSQV